MKSTITLQVFLILTIIFIAMIILWLISDIVAPFILGAIIAYLLDPVADKFNHYGVPRFITALGISILVILIFTVVGLTVLPIILDQTSQLLRLIPEVTEEIFLTVQKWFSFLNLEKFDALTFTEYGDNINEISPFLMKSIFKSSFVVLDYLLLIIIAPTVAIYLLVDWDEIMSKIAMLIPRKFEPIFLNMATEMHSTIASFLRGQIIVCLILACFYSTLLTVLGLQYGFLLGLLSGLISFIPFIGAILGGGIALIISLFQYWDSPFWIGVVMGIFLLGQFIEGNILTPKLVGNSIKLHPLWIIFSISFFGIYFGWVGIMLAVPMAACLGVLLRFALKAYFNSEFYKQ